MAALPAIAELIKFILMKASFSDILAKKELVLIDFFAEWCGPCKMVAPILKEVKSAAPDVSIIKIDVDRNEELAAKYQIRGVPTLILFKRGQQVWRQSGVLQANQIEQIINQHRK